MNELKLAFIKEREQLNEHISNVRGQVEMLQRTNNALDQVWVLIEYWNVYLVKSEEQNNIMQHESLWQSLSLIIYVAISGLLMILPRGFNVVFFCIEEIVQWTQFCLILWWHWYSFYVFVQTHFLFFLFYLGVWQINR